MNIKKFLSFTLICAFINVSNIFAMESKQPTVPNQITQSNLPLNTETDHFKLYCMPNDKEAAQKVLDVAEKNFKKLSADFKHTYSTKINLHVFPSLQDHHNAIGLPSAEDWLINKYFAETHSFFTVSPNNPGSFHSAKSILGLNMVGLTNLFIKDKYTNSIPNWFCLGIGFWEAQFIDKKIIKSLAQDHKTIPTMNEIQEKLGSDSKSCASVFSIIEYINQKWGWDTIIALLADYSSFEKILGVNQETFRTQWIKYLDSNYLDKK
jgi:hypothetical protein